MIKLCFLQTALISSILAIEPHICTRFTALVRGVITASMPSGDKHKVSSISAKMGIAPAINTASTEATKVNGGTITSSPAPTPAAAIAV